uniref:Uncharacterized protein n=1 Tax=Panagrolaimus sp. PS1159 TaxID=55785 RepID=A0AC35FTT9_9BILA
MFNYLLHQSFQSVLTFINKASSVVKVDAMQFKMLLVYVFLVCMISGAAGLPGAYAACQSACASALMAAAGSPPAVAAYAACQHECSYLLFFPFF